ncbi:MAG: hypothetical protein MUC72_01465 [Acidobacteria bacterium]|nr:hypothetical protein [Acidobacteriota bacterium]
MHDEQASAPGATDRSRDLSYAHYIAKFDRLAAGYIPAPGTWTPVDDALYGPPDPFRVPYAQALEMQLRAVRFALERHYHQSRIYHKLCRERGFAPEQVRSVADLDRVPLLPDTFFKDYPEGREFALWLGNIVSGELPRVVIQRSNPSADDVVQAFNEAGMAVTFSSGTSGRHTFIPRDRRTFLAAEYIMAKSVVAMTYPHWQRDWHGYLLMPDPRRTSLFAGRACAVFFDVIGDVRVAVDREVTTEVIRLAMAGQGGIKGRIARHVARRRWQRMITDIIRWLELHERDGGKVMFFGAPFILQRVLERLRRQGRRFAFGERGWVGSAGGWKTFEGERIPLADFRAQVEQVLGIPQKHCLDMYAMVESNACMLQCPEGHCLHVPHPFFRPLVLGDDGRPLPWGKWGRFAFLDAAALSYPGFIMTGDRVRLLERCPTCDRPGPVLDPEVNRFGDAGVRGCAEELRRLVAADLGNMEP